MELIINKNVKRKSSIFKIRKSKYNLNYFDSILTVFMILICISTLYPFWHLLVLSVSPPDVSFTKIHLIPEGFTLDNYIKVLTAKNIVTGFYNTTVRTVLGVILNIIFTMLCAYPLAKKDLPNRNIWTALIVFTMFFNGGLIPHYLLIRRLNMMNTVWPLVLPRLIDTFAMLIARNYIMAIPESLSESAKIDGASELRILFQIVIPISAPIIAVLALWSGVWHWNAWFDSLLYSTDTNKQVLQIILRRVIMEGSQQIMELDASASNKVLNPETIKATTVMVVSLPIIILYPFLQKYFVKGMLVGSVKG